MKRLFASIFGIVLVVVVLQMGCSPEMPADSESTDDSASSDQTTSASALSISLSLDENGRPLGWVETSHSNDADPDYATVFPDNEVNRLDITITPADWQAMQDNMTTLYGEPGTGNGGGALPGIGGDFPGADGGVPGGEAPPDGFTPPQEMFNACANMQEGDPCTFSRQGMEMSGSCVARDDGLMCMPEGIPEAGNLADGNPMMGLSEENPIYVPCFVEFEGQTWWYVGIRYKGQSSLQSTWRSGNGKLPFRLEFDEFEDQRPEVANQRFFGFKELSLASNWSDPSFLREKVAHDIFREAGVPAPHTAFYRVYIDFGEGPTYFGLYTMTEIPDSPMLETQFGDDGGNLYKPTSNWVSFAEEDFDKESNQDEADWSDVQAGIEALHADRSDPATWRAGLEAVFNVDGFLRWLAVNTIIQNWDSYGSMAQNYYLYGDPADGGRLNWIPWDNNLAFMSGMMGGMRGAGDAGDAEVLDGMGGMGRGLSLSLEEVGDNWPLIRYLADNPVYWPVYVSYVRETIEGAFAVAPAQARFQAAHDLIAPYVVGADGEQPGYTFLSDPQEFYDALDELLEHVVQRQEAALEFLTAYEQSPSVTSAAGVLYINEFMADNSATIEDPDEPGVFDDWIEIYNASDSTANMGGMYLTDDLADPAKWQVPYGVTIPAGGYLLFWADEQQGQGDTHTNFKLKASDEAIGLYDTDANGNAAIDTLTFGEQTPDVSFGRSGDGADSWRLFEAPTPGQSNGSG